MKIKQKLHAEVVATHLARHSNRWRSGKKGKTDKLVKVG